ncbi:hypothetical protein BDZ97DRAFT_1905535 [Flammula alnicola]|nr:hypothetical protein BDZ97DRAFT_1905535 [Flammula alnicola]
MASSPSHRSTQSIGANLQLPAQGSGQDLKQQRRMTSPVGSLNLPDGGRKPSPRPPSPLRNGFIMDTSTGIDPHDSEDESDEDEDDEDDRAKWKRSPSPASSVSHLAASFVQRVNDFVGVIAPKSPGMPTDAELEAEAERERDRSRREAEAILTREAQQRKLVEERVLAMMETAKSLPPPPSRSQTMPNPSSPANSQKDTSWLTPTKDKETLTPAQQVILDAKTREKDKDKGKDKKTSKGKEKEWPANAHSTDEETCTLFASSPTPSRPSLSNMPPNLTPSPMRTIDTISSSPSREAPPLYAQFNTQGTLDKLEKWTVGHVRALEERMNDVERWLVDKEKEKEDTASMKESKHSEVHHEVQEIREEVSELQGRVGELGREMAKLATAPTNLSSGPKAQVASVTAGPQNTSQFFPPLASTKTPSGTRLPYPQGDYTSPPDAFSPTNSPRFLNASLRTRPISIPGLPNAGPSSAVSTSYSTGSYSSVSSYGRTMSPSPMSATTAARAISPSPSGTGLPAPKHTSQRQTSISPTPRKRYTPPKRTGTPKTSAKSESTKADLDNSDNDFGDERSATSSANLTGGMGMGDYKSASPSPSPMSNRRLRAQSAYGFSNIPGASGSGSLSATFNPPSVAPLRTNKLRSKSTERLNTGAGTGDGMVSALAGPGGTKFVDPLPIAMPKPIGKVPIGQLVAFFDKDKK